VRCTGWIWLRGMCWGWSGKLVHRRKVRDNEKINGDEVVWGICSAEWLPRAALGMCPPELVV